MNGIKLQHFIMYDPAIRIRIIIILMMKVEDQIRINWFLSACWSWREPTDLIIYIEAAASPPSLDISDKVKGRRKPRKNTEPWCCLDLQLHPKTWVIIVSGQVFPRGDQAETNQQKAGTGMKLSSCQFRHSRQQKRRREERRGLTGRDL